MHHCNFCGNKNISSTTTEYTYKNEGSYLIVNHVPCQQCDYCGEKYFEARVLKQIEMEFFAIQKGKKSSHEISVPIEDFEQFRVA